MLCLLSFPVNISQALQFIFCHLQGIPPHMMGTAALGHHDAHLLPVLLQVPVTKTDKMLLSKVSYIN